MSAKLSSTLTGMALLQLTLQLLEIGPVLSQRLVAWLASEDATSVLDQRCSDGLKEDSFHCRPNHGLCAVLNVELFPKPGGDHNLTLRRKPNGISFCFCCRAHLHKSMTF